MKISFLFFFLFDLLFGSKVCGKLRGGLSRLLHERFREENEKKAFLKRLGEEEEQERERERERGRSETERVREKEREKQRKREREVFFH